MKELTLTYCSREANQLADWLIKAQWRKYLLSNWLSNPPSPFWNIFCFETHLSCADGLRRRMEVSFSTQKKMTFKVIPQRHGYLTCSIQKIHSQCRVVQTSKFTSQTSIQKFNQWYLMHGGQFSKDRVDFIRKKIIFQ